MQRFDIRAIPADERAPLLDEVALSSSVPFHAGTLDSSRPLQFAHLSRYFGDMELTRTSFGNWRGFRTAAQARGSVEPRLVIAVAAGVTVEQGQGQVRQRERAVVPFWSLSPWTVTREQPNGLFRGLSIPAEALGLPFLLMRDLMATDLSASPMGRLAARHMIALSSLPELTPTQAAALSHPTLDLIRAALAAAVGDDARGREPLARTLGLRILVHLKQHATDPDLSADAVAGQFGISRRYLFLVMQQLGVSLQDWVREERLLRAVALLDANGSVPIAISAVARGSGFADHSSFSRAFRLRFGCSPSEWRLQSASERSRLTRRTVRSPFDDLV